MTYQSVTLASEKFFLRDTARNIPRVARSLGIGGH